MKKFILDLAVVMVAVVAISGAFAQTAFAQTATTTATSTSTATTTGSLNVSINSIDTELTQLMNIREDHSISSSTKVTEEISAQQDILNQVITLSTNEISALQTKLTNLPTFATDTEEYSLQSNYLAELSSYNDYFTQESAVVASASTLAQLQTVALSIKTFRDAGYNSEISNMLTFTLLYYDASIISTAENRLTSVSSDLASLEDAQLLLNPSMLDVDVSQAAGLIGKAATLHDQASALILQNWPLDYASTTASSTAITPTASSTATSTVSTNTPDPRNLIEKSIGDVKIAYQIFIGVATSIKTQLDL